ncbi:MAG TPA: hypothetical protein VK427_09140, partial [Kofleriaceae bacterium]|nr:hypothetical protein [Kofleriaceae bacterium]
MHKTTSLLAGAAWLAITGCHPQTGPATTLAVPRERANECVAVCHQLGMRMTAMVVITSRAGCVCEPEPAHEPSAPGAPAAAAGAASGGAVIAAAAAAAEADEARRQADADADAARRQ